MRGIGHTLSRLSATLAFAAGVALLCGAGAPTARAEAARPPSPGAGKGIGYNATTESRPPEAALAVPRIRMHGTEADVAMPQPLDAGDARLVKRILALQAQGALAAADKAAADLDSPLLMGTILAQRYLGRFHRSTAAELGDWLTLYADHPAAPAIHALLLTRLPKGATPPPAPARDAVAQPPPALAGPEPDEPAVPGLSRSGSLDRAVRHLAERGNVSGALGMINRAGISRLYAALLQAELAHELFLQNRDADALAVALGSLRAIPALSQPGLTGYVAGLAAWRLNRMWLARAMFEASADAGQTTPRQRVAAALWAAKASMRLQDPEAADRWLQQAANGPTTLHGLLARRMLGVSTGILSGDALLTSADVEWIAETPAGRRAFALLQAGQADLAETEFRSLWRRAQDDTGFARSLALVTSGVGLSDFATQLADMITAAEGRPPLEPRLAVPRLRPAGGFRVDPPLVYALARLESNFDPEAVSAAGARGLMQIMPVTARYVAGRPEDEEVRLHDPAVNLDIGQRYLAYLARLDGIGNNLLRLLSSYNSGPGLFMRWADTVRTQGEPLMFLEAIPVHETRAFVTRVLTYSWIYAARLHLPAHSLDALAAGRYPRFTPAAADPRLSGTAPPHS